MKIKTLLTTALLCFLFSKSLSAQCSINNLFAEVSDCDIDGFVTIDFEFDVINPGADNMFTVNGNGNNYGTFEYGQTFYTIGPVEGNCNTIYELVLIDLNDNDCQAVWEFEEAFCCVSCNNFIVDYVGLNECTGSGTYFAEILIENPGSLHFEVFIDGISEGVFNYGDEVYTFGPFTGNCFEEHTFEVIDIELECESFIVVEPVCCPEYCSISDITVESIECTTVGNFSIELNFNYDEVEEDNFDVWSNGSYHGTYAYADLPIIIDDFPPNGSENPFITVFGIGADVLCADDLAFEGLECDTEECSINNVEAEASCNDDG